ncbi:MAG: hypothetical protein OZSIB_2889 [Candidatus Ozemobacter sibiricus]|uniref:site-specific DNA-methyltransferase (adenine-specific) n=1 Tax=Candidatus Ozemobacter sibiricus TaxID=2268124 RepID=A0A367ZR97_9BACT|nr:MAG: hypothetical protein OZSIB_2889 [Candidatus Ozemobacter sibiricus]
MRLHEWFAAWMTRLTGRPCRGTPREVLRDLGGPVDRYPWLAGVEDSLYPVKLSPGPQTGGCSTSLAVAGQESAGAGAESAAGPDPLALPDLERRGRGARRARGQFYTPEDLVRRVLRLTGLPPAEGEVLDPACGDGAWLVPVAEAWREAGVARPLERIWGCDLDAEALLICLARLLAVAPAGGWPHLEQRDFLLDPPSLVVPGADFEALAAESTGVGRRRGGGGAEAERCQKAGRAGKGGRHESTGGGGAADTSNDPDMGRFGGFAAVIGNPPYRVNLDPTLRAALSARFSTAEGEKDLYTFFLEGGVRALRPGGTLVMLTSHTYLVNHQCAKIREFLFRRHSPQDLFLLPARFFPQAPGVLPVVLAVRAGEAPSSSMRLHGQYDPERGWEWTRLVDPATLCRPEGIRLALVPPAMREVFARMEAGNPSLGEVARVGVGIQESLVREKGRVSKFVHQTARSSEDVPVLRGREVQPFKIVWEGLYLRYGPHLSYAGDAAVFQGEKILYQNIRHESLPVRLVAALDRQGFFPKNSLSYIARPVVPFTLEYLVGLLNSTLVNAWFAGHFFSFHVTVGQVRRIPIPIADRERRARVESVAREIAGTPGAGVPAPVQAALDEAVAACYLGPGRHSGLLDEAKKLLAQIAGVC